VGEKEARKTLMSLMRKKYVDKNNSKHKLLQTRF
jgi:hypothetical protein